MDAYNVTTTSATLRTYVYEAYNVLGQQIGWVPTSPSNVKFNYSVLSSMQQDIYLQNQTVNSGSQTHNAMNNIEAGNNVTSSTPQGDFVVTGDANVTLHAGNTIIFKPGTTITPGANGHFRAYVDPFFTCTQYPVGKMANDDNNAYTGINDFEVELIEKSQMLTNEDFKPTETYFKVYPNPSNGDISIEYSLDKSDIVEIILHDNCGRPVYKLKNKVPHETGNYQIKLTGIDLPTGIYHCVLQTNEIFKTEKIIILK